MGKWLKIVIIMIYVIVFNIFLYVRYLIPGESTKRSIGFMPTPCHKLSITTSFLNFTGKCSLA